MPCYDPETHDRPIRLEKKVHYLTDLLCYLCKKTEAASPQFIEENYELAQWWIRHQKQDRMIAAILEKRKTLGYHSLTDEERLIATRHDDVSWP